jgi:hypothetical protein
MKINTIITVITGLIILFSCDFGYNYEDEAKWSKWAFTEAPLSPKEIKFIDSISKTKCPIEINRTFIGRIGDKKLKYELIIHCDSLIVTLLNKDSIDKVRKEIINELYVNVICDSVIYDMTRIETQLNIQKQCFPNNGVSFTLKDYLIDSLEQWNGIKILKVGKNKYKRIYLNPKQVINP